MRRALKTLLPSVVTIVTLLLTGCVAGGPPLTPGRHLTARQCADLTALRSHAPLTRERNDSELAALEEAGYQPSLFFDPYYPEDLQAAQSRIERWYRAECAGPGPD